MDISIVIPVYNEEENISRIYNDIKKAFSGFGKQYELIFINDGSGDRSLAVIKSIQQEDACVKIIYFDRNYGKTSALDAGFKLARGEVVVTIDADLQYDPQDIFKMIETLNSADVDAVFGKRMNRTSGLFKVTCSKTANFIRNFLLRESYQDASFAGYKKQTLQGLVLYKNMEVFIPTLLAMQGYKINEISVREFRRTNGRSKYNFRNRFFRLLYALLVVKWLKENQLNYKIGHHKEMCLNVGS